MPFIALHKDTQERIDITEIDDPRKVLKSGDCVCQLCGEPLIIKAGLIVSPHFAHYAKCTSEYAAHPESEAHRQGKKALARFLRAYFTEYVDDLQIDFEVKIPEAKRVADLVLTFPMGWRIAHEVQLANITTEELQQRTEDYARAGIDTVWWLGRSADTPANRFWCIEQLGICYHLNFRETNVARTLHTENLGWD